jgi:predicted ATPase
VSDLRTQLQRRFEPNHRFANFGNVLMRLDVQGFRLHSNSVIEFRSPITAFCGPNGTGKTTLLQLAACGYRQGNQGFGLRDFFAVGQLDPAPFSPSAQVSISMWQRDAKTRTITLSRRNSRWSDYRKREERSVVFLGAARFPPRAEEQAFAFRNSSRLVVRGRTKCTDEVATAVAKLLGLHYDEIDRAEISVKARSGSILSSKRGGVTYSENHMGFGECRIHNLVETLEAQPPQSLILLEEPEISLHQSAQFRLGDYLISLALRRGHQILLSTHSEHLLRALPQASRLLITRDVIGNIRLLPGLASAHVASLLADGYDKILTLLVEDDVANAILTEMLDIAAPQLLPSTRIVIGGYYDDRGRSIGGGKDAIAAALRTMREAGISVAAVLDADARPDASAFVFCLPGTRPPEQEVFATAAVLQYWTSTYGIDVPALMATLVGVDHHVWFDRLAQRVNRARNFLVYEACRIYARAVGPQTTLVEQLQEAANRR